MKTLLMRFVSHLVLISYCTSILRLDYGFACETITTTQTLPPPRHLVLKLRPRPTDFEVKVKRIAEFSQSGEAQEPGLKIKLKARAETSVLRSSSVPKRQTLKSIFISDRVPISEAEMRAYGLREQLDEQSQNVIGFVWKLNDFPDMDLLIVRDGSILATGSADSNSALKFTSPYKVHLENFAAHSVAFKAQNIEFGGQVSIPQLSLVKGHLINKGELRSIGHQSLSLGKGAIFENHSVMAADICTLFSGTGKFVNNGDVISPLFSGKARTFENNKNIEALEINVETQESLANYGLIKAEKTTLKSQGSSLYNQGKIIGEEFYHLEAAGAVHNLGLISGKGGTVSAQEKIINKRVIRNAVLKTRELKNTQTGNITGASFEIEQGKNLGVIEGNTLTIKDGRFINRNTLTIHSLLGTGKVHNTRRLIFTGSAQNRSKIGVKSFVSYSKARKNAVIGVAVTVLPQLHQFLTKSGKLDIDDLIIEDGNPAALYQNWAAFIVGNLTLNQTQFDNHGEAVLATVSGALKTLNNHKLFQVTGKTSLPQATLTNHEFADLKGHASFQAVTNHKDFVALDGLTVNPWVNYGNAEIHKRFYFTTFENRGEMALTDALAETSITTIYNTGNLFLTNTNFKATRPTCGIKLYNLKRLHFSKGSRGIFTLINHNKGIVDIEEGTYDFGAWENHSNCQIKLHGSEWTLTQSEIPTEENPQKHYIENSLLPAIRKIVGNHPFYQNYESFMANRTAALFAEGMSLNDYRDLVLRTHHVKIYEQNIVLPEYLSANNTISVKFIHNTSKISADGKLRYDSQDAPPGIWAAQTFVLKQPGKTLTPADLVGLSIGGQLVLECAKFHVPEPTVINLPTLVLHLSDCFVIDSQLGTKNLEVYAKNKFYCGNGSTLGKLVVDGALTMKVAALNPGFYDIHSTGTGFIQTGEELVAGSVKLEDQINNAEFEFSVHPCARVPLKVSYKKTINNGTSISSGGNLTLQSLNSNVTIYNNVISYGRLILKAHPAHGIVRNEIGQVQALQGIDVYGYDFINTRSVLSAISSPSPYADRRWLYKDERGNSQTNMTSHENSIDYDPLIHFYTDNFALLQSGGEIRFYTTHVKNRGSTIEGAGSIYHGNTLIASPSAPYTGTLINESLSQYIEWAPFILKKYNSECKIPPVPAYLISGKSFAISNGSTTTTGIINARTINIHTHTFLAENISNSRSRPISLESHLSIDLVEYFKSQPHGFLQMGRDGRIAPRYPVLSPFSIQQDDILLLESEAAPSVPPLRTTLPLMIDPAAFPFIAQRALTECFRTQNIDGLSGIELWKELFKRARDIKQSSQTNAITRSQARTLDHLLVAFEANDQYLQPVLIGPARLNNNLTDSGDFSGEEVRIHGVDRNHHSGNRGSAKRNLSITSDGSVERETRKFTRPICGNNMWGTEDYLGPIQEFASEEGSIEIGGGTEIHEMSTQTAAPKGNITRKVKRGGNITLDSLVLTRQMHETQGSGKGQRIINTVEQKVVPNTSGCGGTSTFQHGEDDQEENEEEGKTSLRGAIEKTGQDIVFNRGETIVEGKTVNNTKTTSTRKKYEHISTSGAQQALLLAAEKVHFNGNKRATLKGAVVQGKTLVNDTEGEIVAEPMVATALYYSKERKGNRIAGAEITIDSGQEVMFPTVLDVDKILTTHAKLKLISAQLAERTTIEGIYEEAERELNNWCRVSVKSKGIPKAVIPVIALAITIATQGMGAALLGGMTGTTAGALAGTTMGAMANAGFSALCSQMATTLVATGGDIGKAMKSVAKKDALISLAGSIATAGIMQEFKIAAPTGGDASLRDVATYAVKKAAVDSGVNVALGRLKPEEIIRQAGINILLTTANIYGAKQIGRMYSVHNADGTPKIGGPEINAVTHKVLHTLLGGAIGAARGDMVAGMIGGGVSEMIAEFIQDEVDVVKARVDAKAQEQGILPGTEAYKDLTREEVRSTVNWATLGADITTALAGHDVYIADGVAATALEHNCMETVILAVAAAGTTLAVIDFVDTYLEKGPEAAYRGLQENAAIGMSTMGTGNLVKAGSTLRKLPRIASRAGDLISSAGSKTVAKVKGAFKPTSNKSSQLEVLDLSSDARLMGEYNKVKGHHVHAKKAFEGHPNYDPKKGFAISNELMKNLGINHYKVTTAQRRLFTELVKSGRPNTIYEHTKIAVEALLQGGCRSENIARDIVAQSLRNLKNYNVKAPTSIPWHPLYK